MSYMVELYYKPPPDPDREARLTERVAVFGGRLDFREEPNANGPGGVVLTYEFDEFERAELAADALRQQGEHVEGPGDYGE